VSGVPRRRGTRGARAPPPSSFPVGVCRRLSFSHLRLCPLPPYLSSPHRNPPLPNEPLQPGPRVRHRWSGPGRPLSPFFNESGDLARRARDCPPPPLKKQKHPPPPPRRPAVTTRLASPRPRPRPSPPVPCLPFPGIRPTGPMVSATRSPLTLLKIPRPLGVCPPCDQRATRVRQSWAVHACVVQHIPDFLFFPQHS